MKLPFPRKPLRSDCHSDCFRRVYGCRYWLCALLLLAVGGCGAPPYVELQGQTMGTYFAIKANESTCVEPLEGLLSQTEARLAELNGVYSTYQADSELMQFNNSESTDWVAVSADLARVMRAARELGFQTNGAFDVTVGPLVELWGFGAQKAANGTAPAAGKEPAAEKAPAANKILELQAYVGLKHISVRERSGSTEIRKKDGRVRIDLSALAKGDAVDRLAEVLVSRGCADFLVDIGGEIRVSGKNPQAGLWRLGIEAPEIGSVGQSHAVVSLTNKSVATSGDYRNFRMVDGKRVDHLFDPRFAAPSTSNVVSATVLHESAMWADAYATAFMVLSVEESLALAEEKDLAVLLIASEGGSLTDYHSPAFLPYLAAKEVSGASDSEGDVSKE